MVEKYWIPAFAGMTTAFIDRQFLLVDDSVLAA
jgi:hypothetical protein